MKLFHEIVLLIHNYVYLNFNSFHFQFAQTYSIYKEMLREMKCHIATSAKCYILTFKSLLTNCTWLEKLIYKSQNTKQPPIRLQSAS